MTGRRLSWILFLLLVTTLLAEGRAAQRHWRASRILRAVEAVTLQTNQRGGLPRPIGDHHLRLLAEAGQLAPAWVDVPVARGWQYLLLGRPHGAVRVFEEALELEPRARIYANLGEAYLAAEEPERARRAFEEAILLDPLLEEELRDQMSRTDRK